VAPGQAGPKVGEEILVIPSEKINHPLHYGGDVPHEAIKCITANQLNFVLGNAVKYIFRAGKKGSANDELDDLRKARWYLDWEIRSREQEAGDK